jgi:cytochrome c553
MKKLITVVAILSSIIYAGELSSCTGCHGSNFEKVALGKSKVVKDMSKDEIISTLKGYRDGTYGGAMKSVMQRAVKSMSDEQIEKIAEEIKSK